MKIVAFGILLVLAAGILPADAQDDEMMAGKDTLGKPAPELMAAGWIGSPVTLRSVKGNTVVLNFWNSDTAYFDTPEYFLKSMMADYDKYSKMKNLTFISICRSMTATIKQVERDVTQFKVTPLPTMLDAGGATAHAYKVPKQYSTWVVVIDPDGNIVYNRNKGWYWSSGVDKGKYVHHTMIEDNQKKSPGILDKKAVPDAAAYAAHLYDLQQFSLCEFEAKKLIAQKNEELKEFGTFLKDRIAEIRKKRLSEIEELSHAAPTQAYREAVNFVAAFPGCPEKAAINDIGKGLMKNPAVKAELQAEDAYRRMIVPELVKTPKGTADFDQRVQPMLAAWTKVYKETDYCAAVTDGVEGYKMAAGRSR
ncbi:MAG TPA: redoxin domain-containing protein [Planctomycetota bacterium]|nr:redoxin domain-containing protein [Planctomycetota bacterium]